MVIIDILIILLQLLKLDPSSHPEVLKELMKYINNDQVLVNLKPVYKTFKGWNQDISKCTSYNELPIQAREYVEFIAKELKVKIDYVSVGSDRKQTIKVN